MRGKITKRAVDALRPGGDKETTLWDSEIKGLGVRVRTGRSRTYILRYRPGAGGRSAPLRTLTIGKHGSPWTPDMARAEAKRLLGMVEDGADPAADRSAQRDAPTVAELTARFLAEHAQTKRKTRTAEEYGRLVDKIIVPALGRRKVADVARHDIAKLHHTYRATPYQANRILAVTSKMMNLAEAWGMRPTGSNPCRHVDKFEETARERMISAVELWALGDALTGYEASGGNAYVAAAVKLLVFTGARVAEILGLRWDWVNFERSEARLPDSKTGAKTIHLAPPALAILAALPRVDGNPHVIVGAVEGEPLINLEKPWRTIRSRAAVKLWQKDSRPEIAGLAAELAAELGREPSAALCAAAAKRREIELPVATLDLRLHDLRHGFASIAAASGMGLPIIGKMLGHTEARSTQRYAHVAPDPVKAAAAAVAGKIAGAMQGGGEVVEFKK